MDINRSKKDDTVNVPLASDNGKGQENLKQAGNYYNVYRVEYEGDPHHVAIFVETQETGPMTGHLYHVVGNILRGMRYNSKTVRPYKEAVTFVPGSDVLLGHVAVERYAKFDEVCRKIPPPGIQMTLFGKRLNPNEPLRRCGEWAEEAIMALRTEGVIENY